MISNVNKVHIGDMPPKWEVANIEAMAIPNGGPKKLHIRKQKFGKEN